MTNKFFFKRKKTKKIKFKMEDDQKNQNGRRPKKSKWKTTKKIKMEDNQIKSKWKTTKKFKMEKIK